MLMEEREAKMISLSGGKPCWRIAHFLKPSFPISIEPQINPKPPSHSHPTKPISQISKLLSSKVQFHGWQPLKDWVNWVEKLLPLYESTWKKLNIYEAIMASKCDTPIYKDSIFAVAEKWCSETNTFVLSWGEMTLTLEDIMVLGGYSVTGDSVLSQVKSSNLLKIKDDLKMAYNEINKSKAKRVSHCQWMNVWINKGGEFEHEAFLALWLSRYVLPINTGSKMPSFNKSVISIAVLLANGTKIALAPAVLARIYHDLRLLKEKIVTVRERGDLVESELHLCSPLQLLQVWVWERFTAFSPKPNPLTDDQPRLQRWHRVKIPKIDDVGLAFDSVSAKESFQWRPYSWPLNNWSVKAKLYAEEASWVSVTSKVSLDFESYARVVRNSKLVGLNGVEEYLPHRVSMQFGLDQDIPCAFPRVRDTRGVSWNRYDRPIGDVKLYIPPRLFESDVTTRYLEWWNQSKDVVLIGDSSEERQPSPNRSRRSPCGPAVPAIDIEDSESVASISSSPHRNEAEPADDESDDDHLTLTQLVGLKGTQKLNRSDPLTVKHTDSPLYSAGNDVGTRIQEQKLGTTNTGIIAPDENFTMQEHINGDGIEIEAGSQVRSTTSVDNNRIRTTLNHTPDSSNISLSDRIARMQRIIDIVKAEKGRGGL